MNFIIHLYIYTYIHTYTGKIYLFDIVEVVPEPGQPYLTRKLKSVFAQDQRGPITAIGSADGHLLSAVGQRIYSWLFKDGNLVGKSFIDSHIYTHQIETVKEFVMTADVQNGMYIYVCVYVYVRYDMFLYETLPH